VIRLRSSHDREIVALALPALGALIADPLLSLVDTAFVGRIGTDALGGLGVATALFTVSFFLFNFLFDFGLFGFRQCFCTLDLFWSVQ